MNKFGNIYSVTTFGESHGPAIGGVIEGMPAGIHIDTDRLQRAMNRRRPGQSEIVTGRNERDETELLSGIFNGVTTGTPIGFIIRNTDHRSGDYEEMRHKFRPSHADFTYYAKYGIRDYRGGGRASARETAARMVGGALAAQALDTTGIKIYAYTSQVGDITIDSDYRKFDLSTTDTNAVRCPDIQAAERMERLIKQVKSEGDTVGGVITCVITGCPAGLGEPVGDKLQASLAHAMLSINGAKGFDYGMGFEGCGNRGSAMCDIFTSKDGKTGTLTNHSGGIQGGISNGEDIYFRVAFKPVATLLQELPTVTDNGEPTTLQARGRHDPCVLPRAVPIVEAMTAMVMLDQWLMNKTTRL